MKKLIVLMVMFLTISLSTASAVTQEELVSARSTLRKIELNIRDMKKAMNIAIRGTFAKLNLTPEQIEELKSRYTNGKAELQTLYGDLP